MKPHIQRSNGAWVVYFNGLPVYRVKYFRSAVEYTSGRFGFPKKVIA